ncbi:F-box protein GID2 [Citrus sinensis]|nr:F-box protein GID2 [Citrus sinensis]
MTDEMHKSLCKYSKKHPPHASTKNCSSEFLKIFTWKLVKQEEEEVEEEEGEQSEETGFTNLDENLLFEVLKHADARTLARAACVNKFWHKTAQDESVVLALGGFRRLHSLYLHQLPRLPPGTPAHWGRDEVHLSLSLLSVRYHEMMTIRDLTKQ